jgi:transcriptional regulator with XRE-family HTH domain
MSDEMMPNGHATFGAYIKARRETLGKSIRGLASELDMTSPYLGDIEKGNRYAPEAAIINRTITAFKRILELYQKSHHDQIG